MELQILWFVLIVVLFTGFFFLEGFDYGVGMLLPFVGKSDIERRQVLRTILPVWDGNEVWMITAGGASFAAFPHFYATMFSTFYLALFLMLVCLILRGIAFELRDRSESLTWRKNWDKAIVFGSTVPALLWGIAVTDLIAGLPINANMTYMGGFFGLLSPYSVIGGLTFVFVFAFHGAAFLSLRLANQSLIDRAQSIAKKAGALAVVFFVLCMVLTYMYTDLYDNTLAAAALILAAVFFLIGYFSLMVGASKRAFIGSSLAIVCTTVAFFAGLFPRLMVSSFDPAYSLTIYNSSSTPYTLFIMTIAAGILVPIVLAYQIYTYYIFRKRVTEKDLGHY
ncbi:cytochrome d ubiquinol oxidase subunit II [Selenomonas sp. TAMA-11512]|uniref:cytochrome d ubiquinol oxidase subunit II n=1 Tax=Selenomonas sp. TAMA-11512 TaxID=3095337 RepID=UPI0030905EC4|nr:cytochrome d ubiquinol oxidase subunit II [Selenomonas sp. TAMA-11512]